MRNLFTALITALFLSLCGVTAYAETSVTITPGSPGADSGAAETIDLQESLWTEGGGTAAVPVRDVSVELTPLNVETATENSVPIIRITYEVLPDIDPQTLAAPFEQEGYKFIPREIESRTLPGEALTRPAEKTATTESETDEEAEIVKQFPDFMEYAEDGYSGQLHLDGSTLQTEESAHEAYNYPYTKTREIPGLDRNDPSYIAREWEGMALTGLSFKQGADGRYTATATYTGTATGSRATGYVTTAVYRGEVTKESPGTMRYTVLYEGTPLALPVALPAEATEAESTVTEQTTLPTTATEPAPVSEAPDNDSGMTPLIASGLIGGLLGAAAMRFIPKLWYIIKKREEYEE